MLPVTDVAWNSVGASGVVADEVLKTLGVDPLDDCEQAGWLSAKTTTEICCRADNPAMRMDNAVVVFSMTVDATKRPVPASGTMTV